MRNHPTPPPPAPRPIPEELDRQALEKSTAFIRMFSDDDLGRAEFHLTLNYQIKATLLLNREEGLEGSATEVAAILYDRFVREMQEPENDRRRKS